MLRGRMGADRFGQNLETLAEYLGGGVAGESTITFPGPGHSAQDRSASVTFCDDAWNGWFKAWSFSDPDEVNEIEAAVFAAMRAIGWGDDGSVIPSAADKRAQGRSRAAWMWGFGRALQGSPAEAYLASRGLACPETDALAYWAHGRFGRNRAQPMMLAAVRAIDSNDLLAVHRTALSLEGQKAYVDLNGSLDCRAFTGSPKGGAIKIHPAGSHLGVGEGVETSLSLRAFKGCEDLPVWSLGSAHGLAGLPVLDGVERLIVAEDNDTDGICAAAEVVRRWKAAGRAVRVVGPRGMPGREHLNDLNDIVRNSHGQKTQGRGIGQ